MPFSPVCAGCGKDIDDMNSVPVCEDCASKIEVATPSVSCNSRYVEALGALRVAEDGNKGRAWNEAVDACIEEIQRLNPPKAADRT